MKVLYSNTGEIREVLPLNDNVISLRYSHLKTLITPFQYDIYEHPLRYKIINGKIVMKKDEELINILNPQIH